MFVRFLGLFLAPVLLFAQADQLALKSQQARQLMAAGRFADAIPIYQELVQAVPGNPGLLLNLGMAQHMAGRHGDAVPHLRAAVKLQPDMLPAWLFLSASHMELSQPAEALPALHKALELDPGRVEAHQMLGDASFILGRFEQAAAAFGKLTGGNPADAKAWYGLGRSYEALARSAFENLAKQAPDSGWVLALVAEARAQARQNSSAFFFYRKALEQAPGMRGLHAGLAMVYENAGHPEWAEVEKKREAALPPPDCRTEKLECEFVRGNHQQVVAAARALTTAPSYYWQARAYNELALQAYSRLAQLPPSAELHALIAEMHRTQGRHVEAVKELQAALKLLPGDARLERELAISLHSSRDYKAAQPLLQRLVRQEPNSPELNFLLGDVLLSAQEASRAVPYLEKAVERDPTLLPARASLARAYLQAGEAGRAVPHLEAALPVDEDGSLHYQLARAYQGSGRQEEARALLKKYQEIRQVHEEQRASLEEEVKITPPH